MKRNAEGVPKFLSGREFSNREIQEIQETVRAQNTARLARLVRSRGRRGLIQFLREIVSRRRESVMLYER